MVRIPHIQGMLHPETAAWAERRMEEGLDVQFCEHQDEGGRGYYYLLCRWWEEPGDLIIVEQDICPAEDAVREMMECEFDWCSCPYLIHAGEPTEALWGWGFGCVKFSERLRQLYPELMLEAGCATEYDPYPDDDSFWVDVRLGCLLASRGYLPHGHAQCRHYQRSREEVLT